MIYSFSEIRKKEVICIDDGEKLGFIDDVELDSDTSEIRSMIIYGRKKFFGMSSKEPDITIECSQIRVIGTETILISLKNSRESGNTEKYTKNKTFIFKSL